MTSHLQEAKHYFCRVQKVWRLFHDHAHDLWDSLVHTSCLLWVLPGQIMFEVAVISVRGCSLAATIC
ncbi:hypothetical protein CICLE_v10033277mg [Citrus x clementina]|uniref:Uncharacterized protein n=2 Tax=Citrus TaxID=2706 RepID=A0A067ERJ0_CITSI|nr:hypothetical protein CICLE_v10033277mg [Citrus x clementina]KDO53832.1 hypothetical protein CISIN_1g045578mg [Citrus sinensis]